MEIKSPAFANGGTIPQRYTCDGLDISPPLQWTGLPPGTATLALIVDDPDAPGGTWLHWLVYDFPPTLSDLPEGQPQSQYLPSRGRQGLNDFRRLGYGGPCPPPGKPHRYMFTLFALDFVPDLKPGIRRAELETAMANHIVGRAHFFGVYQR